MQTFYYHQNLNLRALPNGMGNVNNLTIRFPFWVGTAPFPNEPISLPRLRELSLTNVPHSLFSLERVESLELRVSVYWDIGTHQWLYKLPKLKRLVLCGLFYSNLNTKSSFLLENLTHLRTNIRISRPGFLYHNIDTLWLTSSLGSNSQHCVHRTHRRLVCR